MSFCLASPEHSSTQSPEAFSFSFGDLADFAWQSKESPHKSNALETQDALPPQQLQWNAMFRCHHVDEAAPASRSIRTLTNALWSCLVPIIHGYFDFVSPPAAGAKPSRRTAAAMERWHEARLVFWRVFFARVPRELLLLDACDACAQEHFQSSLLPLVRLLDSLERHYLVPVAERCDPYLRQLIFAGVQDEPALPALPSIRLDGRGAPHLANWVPSAAGGAQEGATALSAALGQPMVNPVTQAEFVQLRMEADRLGVGIRLCRELLFGYDQD